jgi:hypothetical protein
MAGGVRAADETPDRQRIWEHERLQTAAGQPPPSACVRSPNHRASLPETEVCASPSRSAPRFQLDGDSPGRLEHGRGLTADLKLLRRTRFAKGQDGRICPADADTSNQKYYMKPTPRITILLDLPEYAVRGQ